MRIVVAVLCLVALGAGALHAYHRRALELAALEEAGASLLAHTREVERRFAERDGEAMLSELGTNRHNGSSLRLDEQLGAARITPALGETAAAGPELAFEFSAGEPLQLRPPGDAHRIEDGVLHMDAGPESYLISGPGFDTGGEPIVEIEVRIRVERGTSFSLGWSTDELTSYPPGPEQSVRLHDIGVVPDGAFHTYRLDAERALKLGRGIRARSFVVLPSDAAGDRVSVDFVRLIQKREKYAAAPVGRGYERIDREVRSVIHAQVPRELRFAVDVPEHAPRLDLGMAPFERGRFQFAVAVESEGDGATLYQQTLRGQRWRDVQLDLSPWAGRRVELTLHVDGPDGAMALFSSPHLTGAPRSRLNVILLVEDALRADHLSSYGHVRPTSPHTDRLAAGGVLFEHAFSQATKTRASVPSYMTSLYPTVTGVWNSHHHLGERFLTLAEILRAQGFATGSFIQNLNAGPAAGLHQGFDALHKPAKGSKRPEHVVPKALEWIESRGGRNFFLYLHLLDPHGAYDPPSPFDAWYHERPPSEAVARDLRMDPAWLDEPTLEGRRLRYDGEIRSNDEWVGELVAFLHEREMLDDTLIVLISDHGEYLGEHGLWEHTPPGFIQGLHVPLLLHHPSRLPAGARITAPVGLLDVTPTVLDIAGVPSDGLPLQGRSLLELLDAEPALPRLVVSEEVISYDRDDPERVRASLFLGRHHWLNSSHQGRRGVRAFDILADPEETEPLAMAARDPLARRRVVALMRELKQANLRIWSALTEDAAESVELDPETQDQLRALGYIE